MNTKNNLTAIVILNWNRIEDTKKCINSLFKIKNSKYKIMLVDNGSTDGDANKLRKVYGNKIEIIPLINNIGFTGGVNTGINFSSSFNPEFYLLLNNDTVVQEDFLRSMITTAESKSRIGIVAPVIYDMYSKNRVLFAGTKMNWLLGKPFHIINRPKKILKYNYLTGCCLLIKKDVVEKAGLLDDRFFAYFEDNAYCIKVREAGFECVCDPNAIIYHKESASSNKKGVVFTYLISRNRILFINNYFPLFYKLYFNIFNTFKLILVLAYFLSTKQNSRAYAFWKGFVDGIRGIGGIPNI